MLVRNEKRFLILTIVCWGFFYDPRELKNFFSKYKLLGENSIMSKLHREKFLANLL